MRELVLSDSKSLNYPQTGWRESLSERFEGFVDGEFMEGFAQMTLLFNYISSLFSAGMLFMA